MPPHYALSDAFIVLVTIFAGNALRENGQNLLAFAMACFGIAAAVGVVRFAGGLQDELASLHSGASQYLGLVGTLAVASACVFRGGGRGDVGDGDGESEGRGRAESKGGRRSRKG